MAKNRKDGDAIIAEQICLPPDRAFHCFKKRRNRPRWEDCAVDGSCAGVLESLTAGRLGTHCQPALALPRGPEQTSASGRDTLRDKTLAAQLGQV